MYKSKISRVYANGGGYNAARQKRRKIEEAQSLGKKTADL